MAEPRLLRLCRDVLAAEGFTVDAVDSGIGALVTVRERRPDLVLIDLQLRDVPGREAAGWLRSDPALQSSPIITVVDSAEAGKFMPASEPGTILRSSLSRETIRRAVQTLSGRGSRSWSSPAPAASSES